jgi:exonuclease III
MSWNVRGLNNRARGDPVRTLVGDVRPSIVCLQETKLDVIQQHLVFAMLGINFSEFAYLPASNTRGGILIAAKESECYISDVHVGCYSLTIRV